MIYYTADLHLGHANIIKHCGRPFASVEEMDRILIGNWNARVKPEDHVFIIGDLSFRSGRAIEEYLEMLQGHKHLVLGNHDSKWTGHVDLDSYFDEAALMLQTVDEGRNVIMCHYPMMTWPHRSYHVYGHIHANTNGGFWPLLRTYENAFNAGVDVNGFVPVTFEELASNNVAFKARDSTERR